MTNLYENAVKELTSKGKFYISLGLERVSAVLELLGNPQENLKIIHVAGTNGKGSTSRMLSEVLKTAGYKVGLYTSPHLLKYTERVKIDNLDISDDEFSERAFEVMNLADSNSIHLTEFEILTVLAYKYFFDKRVDIAIIETGLGGRLDATNAISKNLFSIITSISIDHKDRLGDTIEKIAFEKAGIIKQNCPVIVSEGNKGYQIIKNQAESIKSMIFSPKVDVQLVFEDDTNFAIFNNKKYEFSLLGLWQKDNLELVLEAINILKDNYSFVIDENCIEKALKSVNWPARLQYIKSKNVIIDGAHNEDAAIKLRDSLDFYFPDKQRTWIYGSLNTKEYEKIINALFRKEDEIYFCHFENKNSISFDEISKCTEYKINSVNICKAENILNYNNINHVTIIAGSFYMIGEMLSTIENTGSIFS